ncbi:MAG: hypothetical protein ACTSQO_01040 [Candidatus Helarchaeota archaeon]
MKYINTGVLLWNQSWGGNRTDVSEWIDIDSKDRIFIAGYTDSFSNDVLDYNVSILSFNTFSKLIL